MVPIFDCNSHPTLTGQWFGSNRDASFKRLENFVNCNNVLGACAVGLWDVESYHHDDFLEKCQSNQKLIPVAGFSPSQSRKIENELEYLKELGYKGIKIHPLSCNTKLTEHRNELIRTLQKCAELDMVLMYCTYFNATWEKFPKEDPYWELGNILKESPQCKVILIHGGVTRLLQYAELAKSNVNVLLDLSFTINKFNNSSIEADIEYLFGTLDQRICLGSDFPEYTIEDVRGQAERLSSKLPEEKIKNIYFKNISKFFNLPI